MTNLVLIAPPAAGKGTQSKLLVENFGYVHISTGDLLRDEVNKNTSIGNEINSLISSGKLVDDNIILKLLENKLLLTIKENKNFIIDGFPRNINQAKMLVTLFDKLNVDNYKVINMNLDYDNALKRVVGRYICESCGKSYNLLIDSLKPKQDDICDSCNIKLVKRTDDTEETFKERYNTYVDNTNPIINYFNDLNKVINISVNDSVENIYNNIKTYVTEVD